MIITEKKENSLFSVYDSLGVKRLTRLRLQFSHLNEHKFRHGFGDTVNPMRGYNTEIEDTEHFLLLFILFKDSSSSLVLTKLTLLLHNQIAKNKSIFCCQVSYPTNLIP